MTGGLIRSGAIRKGFLHDYFLIIASCNGRRKLRSTGPEGRVYSDVYPEDSFGGAHEKVAFGGSSRRAVGWRGFCSSARYALVCIQFRRVDDRQGHFAEPCFERPANLGAGGLLCGQAPQGQ